MSEKVYCRGCRHDGCWPINGYEEVNGCVHPNNRTTFDTPMGSGWDGMSNAVANPDNSCELFESGPPLVVAVVCLAACAVVVLLTLIFHAPRSFSATSALTTQDERVELRRLRTIESDTVEKIDD